MALGLAQGAGRRLDGRRDRWASSRTSAGRTTTGDLLTNLPTPTTPPPIMPDWWGFAALGSKLTKPLQAAELAADASDLEAEVGFRYER